MKPTRTASGVARRDRRVLVLDEGWIATPYFADGLKGAGYQPHVYTSGDLAMTDSQHRLPPVESSEYIDAVGALWHSQQFDRVLPLTEAIFYRIWDAMPTWEANVFPRTQQWQRDLLRDKSRLSDFVAERGVRTPALRRAGSADEVHAAATALGLPLVVKGTTGSAGATVFFVDSESAALDHIREATPLGETPPFLQQVIDGPTFLVAGVFHDGDPVRLYAAEMAEVYPARTGPSIRHRTTGDESLINAALSVFRALRWTGIAQSDWVRSAEGCYYFLEVNPRPWASITAPAAAGVDLFTPFAALLDGRSVPADLAFKKDLDTALFPQYLRARVEQHGVGSHALRRLLSDRRIWEGIPWRRPRLALQLAQRMYWSWRKRTRHTHTPRPRSD